MEHLGPQDKLGCLIISDTAPLIEFNLGIELEPDTKGRGKCASAI